MRLHILTVIIILSVCCPVYSAEYHFGTVDQQRTDKVLKKEKSISKTDFDKFKKGNVISINISDIDRKSDLHIKDTNGELIYKVPKFIIENHKGDELSLSDKDIKNYDRINFRFGPFNEK